MSDTPLPNSESPRDSEDTPESQGSTPGTSSDDAERTGHGRPASERDTPGEGDTGKATSGKAASESNASTKASEPSSAGKSENAGKATKGKGGSNVPPEKAPSKQPASEEKDEQSEGPAAALKGLQESESENRRGLLAGSRRLQSLLTSDQPLGVRNMLWATTAVLAVIVLLLAATGRIGTVTQSIADSFRGPQGSSGGGLEDTQELEEVVGLNAGTFSFTNLGGHPDEALAPYFAGSIAGASGSGGRGDLISRFRQFTDIYVQRYGEDDNFTLRITSGGEADSLLEVFTFEEERQQYRDAGEPLDFSWGRINSLRRAKTRELVDKYVAQGVPQGPIRVKWGLADMTKQARERDKPFIEYEIRLSRYFGKSLLMTEIGTKETFNQDELVSNVNAKSRYQLMPSLISEFGLDRYNLSTSAGNSILVAEEQHPFFSMEPAFMYLTSSINAMGHEIPGISAYHTGVNNIYKNVYDKFLKNGDAYISPSVTTADAYAWAVTEGFDVATRGSSFGEASRAYVVAAYGALKATEEAVIDTSETMLADRVQLAQGQSISLDDLLTTLAENGGGALLWKAPDSLSLYERFRPMNKHMHLPSGPSVSGDSVEAGVPQRGNVTLTPTAGGDEVRFFLPPGARAILKSNGYGSLIDESSVFQFNHNTYPDPTESLRQEVDREYSDLISDIRQFGFTTENREELARLAEQFNEMAGSPDATHYRRLMSDVISQHRQFWRYPGWETVRNTVQTVLGRSRIEPQQPDDPSTQPLETRDRVDPGDATP